MLATDSLWSLHATCRKQLHLLEVRKQEYAALSWLAVRCASEAPRAEVFVKAAEVREGGDCRDAEGTASL